MQVKKRIELIKGYDLLLFKEKKDFEVKIVDNFSGETLIIDNSFMNKKSLKLEAYIPLCHEFIDRLLQGIQLSQLSLQ